MQNGMNLQELLTEVIRQNDAKRDFVASTHESIRMVEFDSEPHIILLKEGAEALERFTITEHCHRQLASRLSIPWKYYQRLLNDHLDLVIHQVNALFEREPQTRMVRTLDGQARAFLSDRYRRLDNAQVLEQALPPILKGDVETSVLSCNVSPNNMHMKVLFTDDSLKQDIGLAPHSNRSDVVRPGLILGNSEVGQGLLFMKGFFFRDYCTNGCVFGMYDAFEARRTHVGGKITAQSDFQVFSDETQKKEDELVIAQITETLKTMSDPNRVREMGNRLREIKTGEKANDPIAAMELLAENQGLSQQETNRALQNFLEDGDYSQWGAVNAVTKVANNEEEVSYERACELEEIGSKIIQMNAKQWLQVAVAERVAA